MPTYKNIVSAFLLSQYNTDKIPEFGPPPTASASNERALASQTVTLIHPILPIVTVYIPTYPASTFWLSYSVNVLSPNIPTSLQAPFYFFKLFLNGRHFASWGCGADDDFKGRTMFGIFRSQDDIGALEKRIMTFEEDENAEGVIELRFYRAEARERIRIEQDTVPQIGGTGGEAVAAGNIILHSTGPLALRHPKRFYNYYLLDAIDQPRVTFRWIYRGWDALKQIGILSPRSSKFPSPESSRASSPSKDPDLSAKELKLKEGSKKATENAVPSKEDAVVNSETRSFNLRTKPLPPTPLSSLRSSSPTDVFQDSSGSPRPKSFPNIEQSSSTFHTGKHSSRPISEISPKKPLSDLPTDGTKSQSQPADASKARNPELQVEDLSPRPKRVSSLLSPPKLFPGALYPSPPIHRPIPSSPTKASFSNTVSLLMAPPSVEASDPSAGALSKPSEVDGNHSSQKTRSPSKFKIADFLVRRDNDSKGSRHSVGKRKTGQTPKSPGNRDAVSEFGTIEPKSKTQNMQLHVGKGKENNVIEGTGTTPRGGNLWRGKIRLGGKRKKLGKSAPLAESTNVVQ